MSEHVTTDELHPKQTDPLQTPLVIESDHTASEATHTQPSPEQEPPILAYATVPLAPGTPLVIRREFHFNSWLLVAALLLVILAGEHISPVITYIQTTYFHHWAHVTLFTTQKTLRTNYSFLAVTGTAQVQQKQIASRLLTVTTPTKTQSIQTTGIGHTPPVQATGSLTFYNEAPYVQTVQAGTVLTASSGVQISTDETVSIAAGNGSTNGSANAPAHTIQGGTGGNIPPLAINGFCCITGIYVKNTSSFTGGEDPQAYPMVSKEDADSATKNLTTPLDSQAKNTLVGQMQSSEQQLTPVHCSLTATVSPKVGEKATQATVTVFETCSVQVYDYAALARLTTQQFTQDTTAKFGGGFTPKHDVTLAIEKISLLDSRHTIYQLAVTAQGSVIFHPSANQLQNLTQVIAGKSISQARTELLHMKGIEGAYIQPLDNSQTLPTDPNQITITIS